jgi:hypothetical protein
MRADYYSWLLLLYVLVHLLPYQADQIRIYVRSEESLSVCGFFIFLACQAHDEILRRL